MRTTVIRLEREFELTDDELEILVRLCKFPNIKRTINNCDAIDNLIAYHLITLDSPNEWILDYTPHYKLAVDDNDIFIVE